MEKTFAYGVAAMAVVLVVSNYLVQFPFPPLADWLTWAAFSYPVAFLVADCVNRAAGPRVAARVAIFGFCFGVPLSFAFIFFAPGGGDWPSAARIAAASGVAFACAQAMDIATFNKFRRLAWWLPPLLSSAPASIVDAAVFFSLAFAGAGVPWVQLAAGDLAVKALMILLLLPPYRILVGARREAVA